MREHPTVIQVMDLIIEKYEKTKTNNKRIKGNRKVSRPRIRRGKSLKVKNTKRKVSKQSSYKLTRKHKTRIKRTKSWKSPKN